MDSFLWRTWWLFSSDNEILKIFQKQVFVKMKRKINGKSDWAGSNADPKAIIQSIFRARKQKNDFWKNFYLKRGGSIPNT
jgi:hypothetical protein